MRYAKHKVWLNNKSLCDADPRLTVLSVADIEPKNTVKAMSFGGRDGGFIAERRRDELTVRVEFAIRERLDRVAWTRALAAARSWCADGEMEIYTRPGQSLDVVCTKLPTAGKNIFDALTAEFTAYACPYWREKTPNTASVTAGTAGSLWIPGDGILTPVDVTVTASAAMSALTVTAGYSSIALTGLSVAEGGTVVFSHDAWGFLSIKTGTTSLLDKRTAASSDDLMIPSGASSALTVSAGTAVFSARGCYR